MSSKLQSVKLILEGAAFAPLRAELARQERLLQAVKQGLPAHLSEHCRYCVGKDDRLFVYVDSSAWSSQLRFFGPDLLAHLEKSVALKFKDLRFRTFPRLLEPDQGPSAG